MKRIMAIAAARFIVLEMISGCSGEPSSQPDKSSAASLSTEKINELRKEYPLSTGSPQNVDLQDQCGSNYGTWYTGGQFI